MEKVTGLSDKTINKLQKYYGKAIRRNVNRNSKTEREINSAFKSMQDAIFAVLYHCVMMPGAKKRYKFCPKSEESWCKYWRTKRLIKTYTILSSFPELSFTFIHLV